VVLHSELGEARAALRAGQPAIAAALARRALDRDPTDVNASVLLGLSLEAQGRGQEAVGVLAAAGRAGSDHPAGGALPAEAGAALARLLPAALPDHLAPELLGALPGAGPAGTVGMISFRVIAVEGAMPVPVTDPKYGWKFSRRAAVYIGDARRYSIYYQEAADRRLASRVAELLGRLHAAAARLGPPPPAEVCVWLPRSGQPGGEQYRDSIYLFAVDVARGDSEWVREVAHELGHIVLPSFARYEAPEPMENGYLGQRLLPKWLMDLGERTVWDGRVSLAEYVRERVKPLRSQFLEAGPASPLRTDRGPAGMDYAIGMVLALEAQHGPSFLARMIRRNEGAGVESLLLAYRDEVAAVGQYRIPAELSVPGQSQTDGMAEGRLRFRRAAYRAYLPSGLWNLTARGERLEGLRVSADGQRLASAGGSGRDSRFALATGVSRWHLIQLEAREPGAALTEIEIAPATRAVSQAILPGKAVVAPRVDGRNEPLPARR
jgi:tetratricopeptide repeat protein